MTAPLGGPVVPEVKITTPAALSSRYRSEEIRMSEGCNADAHKEWAIGMQHTWWVVDVLIDFSSDSPNVIDDEAVRSATARDLRTK